LGVIESHVPLSLRDSDVVSSEEEKDEEWQIRRMSVYAAMTERLDRCVGRIIDELRRQNVLEKALVLFMSDDGGSHKDIGFQNGLNTLGGDQFTLDGRKIQIGRDPTFLSFDFRSSTISPLLISFQRRFDMQDQIPNNFVE
jgi:arylsulfatase A-like enzyme